VLCSEEKDKRFSTYNQAGDGNDIGILLAVDRSWICKMVIIFKRKILPEIPRGEASRWVILFVPCAGRVAILEDTKKR